MFIKLCETIETRLTIRNGYDTKTLCDIMVNST